LTASQIPGNTLPDFTSCIFSSVDDLYSLGARNFVLFNLAPLDLAPLYANESYGGVDESWLWQGKNETFVGSNKTEASEIMREYVGTVNQILKYGLGFEAVVERRWKGSEMVLFDVHRLVSCYFYEPTYLFASRALVVTSFFPRLAQYHPASLQSTPLGSRTSTAGSVWKVSHASRKKKRFIRNASVHMTPTSSTHLHLSQISISKSH
jgi:hypothetical protein